MEETSEEKCLRLCDEIDELMEQMLMDNKESLKKIKDALDADPSVDSYTLRMFEPIVEEKDFNDNNLGRSG